MSGYAKGFAAFRLAHCPPLAERLSPDAEQRARDLWISAPHDKLCPSVSSTGYCNCYSARAIWAITRALATAQAKAPPVCRHGPTRVK